MNLRTVTASLVPLLATACIIPDPGYDVEGRFHVMGGGRRLEETNEFDAFERTPTFGFSIGFGAQETGPGIELGALYSEDEESFLGSDVDAKVFEVFSGYRYDLAYGPWRPYAGFGIAYVGWSIDSRGPLDIDDEDDTIGGYATVGVDVLVTDIVSLGLRGRYFVGKELNLDRFDVDPDFGEVLFTLGFRY